MSAASGAGRLCGALVCGLLLLAGPAPADPASREPRRDFPMHPALGRVDDRARRIQVEPVLRLAEVRPEEILVGGTRRAISEGRYVPGGPPPGGELPELHVTRSVPALWRMYVPEERLLGSLQVRYEILAPDGESGRLASDRGTGPGIRAVAYATPPVVVERDGEGAIVEGGLTLLLDLEEIRSAGTYSGTLSITIDNF